MFRAFKVSDKMIVTAGKILYYSTILPRDLTAIEYSIFSFQDYTRIHLLFLSLTVNAKLV